MMDAMRDDLPMDVDLIDLELIGDDTFAVPLELEPVVEAQAEGPVCVNCHRPTFGGVSSSTMGAVGEMPSPSTLPTKHTASPAYDVPLSMGGGDAPITRKDVGRAAVITLALGGLIAGIRWIFSR